MGAASHPGRARDGALDLEREITIRNRNLSDNDRPQKIMHVDLDYVYDPDPAQQERNLGHLLDRIGAMGVNAVYLQAFSDPDGNGSADAVYFPSRHVPMRADLLNRAAWQIRTRTPVKRLYAWMPMLSWELPANDPAAGDKVVTLPGDKADHVNMGYVRLSPFSQRARQAIREIYQDLARAAPFDGLLFHDDVTLSDYEDASSFALRAYAGWGLPPSVQEIRKSDDLLGSWTILKINALDDFAMELADEVREQQPTLKVASNLYAQVVLNPKAEVWYSQSLDNSMARYDFTAIMAMPYMEKATDPAAFFHDLVNAVDGRRGAMKQVVFELQSVDWRDGNRPIPAEQLAEIIRSLYAHGGAARRLLPRRPVQRSSGRRSHAAGAGQQAECSRDALRGPPRDGSPRDAVAWVLAFVFYYPLFMSFLWMIGAALFYWRFERADAAWDQPRFAPEHAAGQHPDPLLTTRRTMPKRR